MKRILSALFAILFASLLMLNALIPVSAESLYIRKIVSVVYDDSGSMYGDKWAYANYAMQSFCGMLNSEDQLYVTYMSYSQLASNYDPQNIDLSASGIQGSVDSIRKHTSSGSTPYTAVDIAYNKLKNVSDSNPNTQYWLVVITDGEFDETYANSMSSSEKKRFLNENFKNYTDSTMPNGTKPQVTFLGIGDVVSPDEDPSKGIFTYSASSADGIIGAMSDMADRISGRTRLQNSDIKKIDEKTIQVSSSIPLLNIAAFVQGSQARITKAVFDNESNIPISRNVTLSYPGYSDLVGGAFLLGDSKVVIGSGTYDITFDKNVELKDVIILFEPALEMRMTVSVNGKEISDYSDLNNVMEDDKISVSYKIYEMGTETEVDPSLMPTGTKFEITISEDGKIVEQKKGKDMQLSDFVLKNIETEITAAVIIEGFNPIDSSLKFTPTKYVPPIVYSIRSDYGSDVKSVKFDDIASNKDLTLQFTVFADGVAITDVNAVKALNPVIRISPQGNDGEVTYSKDGVIVFTPNLASTTSNADGSYDVEVTCTLEDGTTATQTYTVLISTYLVVPANATDSVKKTELFDNRVSVSFYITKDGVKLDKSAVEKNISVILNEEYADLKTNVVVANDGTITVTPYSEEQHILNFWTWLGNWYYYFGLASDDIVVTLSHSFGSATGTIDIVEESLVYQLVNVYLPLVIELALLIGLCWWVYAIFAKPRFLPGAVLYIANLSYGGTPGDRYHEIYNVTEVNLKQYNSLKYMLKPTLESKKHHVGKDLTISAGYGGTIYCHSQVWYKGEIIPNYDVNEDLSHPQLVKNYIDNYDGSLKIQVISVYDGEEVHAEETIDNTNPELYYIHTNMAQISTVDGIQVIDNGTIFAYAIRINN